jgi:hypothetical protein
MKSFHFLNRFVCAFAILVTGCFISELNARAESGAAATDQKKFKSPEDAVNALRAAVEANDRDALDNIFGPELKSLRTGDKVQDAKNARKFAAAMEQNCQLDKEGDNEVIIEVGTNDWPMPIPLMQTNGQWYFDTVAGKEEIIDRHIGKDELAAIGVCRTYVMAQKEYAAMNGGVFAQKFNSAPGKQDGVYWPNSDDESAKRFGALVAEAQARGENAENAGPTLYHGYYFKILTRQGPAAPGGKMNYLSDGVLKNGFALVAYPEKWDQSGVMTFIVSQDGTVYQQDFGNKSARMGAKIKEYNPDSKWSQVQDQGI